MRHLKRGRKFSRTSSHRKAMFANMATALVQCEQIKTTLPKAKDLRPIVEKYVTLAKRGGLHAYRSLIGSVRSPDAAKKLMEVLGPRYKERPGGYLRIMKAGFRHGDNAPMAVIEFVDREPEVEKNDDVTLEAKESKGSAGAKAKTEKKEDTADSSKPSTEKKTK